VAYQMAAKAVILYDREQGKN